MSRPKKWRVRETLERKGKSNAWKSIGIDPDQFLQRVLNLLIKKILIAKDRREENLLIKNLLIRGGRSLKAQKPDLEKTLENQDHGVDVMIGVLIILG